MGPLCIFSGVKGQSLPFPGISSWKDIVSTVVKGIVLDKVTKMCGCVWWKTRGFYLYRWKTSFLVGIILGL